MTRACSPGGRFNTDFETQAISNAITMDLRNPVGTLAQWWLFDSYKNKFRAPKEYK